MITHLASPRHRLRWILCIAFAAVLAACKTPGTAVTLGFGSVTGRLYDARTRQPLGNVQVRIDPLATVLTSPDGSFLLRRVPTGEQKVTILAPGGYAAPSPIPVEVHENQTSTLEATPLFPAR